MEPAPPRKRARRSSVRSRICIHCGRNFRRTEHLERHIRTHTKEKPFGCFCGASFTRRDLLKRHQRISHQDGLISPHSQPDQSHLEGQSNPSTVPDAHHPQSSPVSQWTPQQQHSSYLDAPAVVQDADVLQAAQLLLPTNYQPSPQPLNPYLPEEFNHFQEFTHFLDSIGLPAEWVPTEIDQPQIQSAVSEPPEISRSASEQQPGSSRAAERSRADSPFHSWLPSVPPGDQSLGTISDYEPPQETNKACPLRVSEEQRLRLAAALEEFRHVIPDFVLPSRHTLNRYLTSFFDGFHSHLPFIHLPTFRMSERAPELVLGFMTIGAQYRFEHRNADRLYYAAKAIVLERLSKEWPSITTCNPPMPPHVVHPGSRGHSEPTTIQPSEAAAGTQTWKQMEFLRSLLVLMGFATWERAELVQEAFGLQSLLVQCLRAFGLTETLSRHASGGQLDWHEWAEEESMRRSKLIAFCFVHIHSVAYNIYPVLRSSEIHLRLPCSTKEWKAGTAAEWQAAQKDVGRQQLCFQDALSRLLNKSRSTALLDPIPAPLGNYILLHGLLQRIHLVSELALPTIDQSMALPTEELNRLERALRAWTSVWQQAPESSLDPHNENGPIPFTSSTLLGMAYVRLCLNLGPYRQLETRDPACIAAALHRSPRPERSYRLIPALIYAAHTISIPVRLGIDYVARSQAFFWSVRHSLASLECAVLLSKWLFSLAEPGYHQSLSENESRILRWTRCIVQEAYDSMDLDDDESLANYEPESLGLAVIKIWARFFRQNTQWPFINVMGLSLERYAAMLRPA